jgi:hypothetical protein
MGVSPIGPSVKRLSIAAAGREGDLDFMCGEPPPFFFDIIVDSACGPVM